MTLTFDIRGNLRRADGSFDLELVDKYLVELVELFMASSEGAPVVRGEAEYAAWSFTAMRYGVTLHAVSPVTMQPEHFYSVLFETFPEEVVAQPQEAGNIVREMAAFMEFLHREYALENAEACRQVLDARAAEELHQRMDESERYSSGKFVAMCALRGLGPLAELQPPATVAERVAQIRASRKLVATVRDMHRRKRREANRKKQLRARARRKQKQKRKRKRK